MPTPDVHPNTLRLMLRMTAPPPPRSERFVGQAVDTAKIDGLALGDLWALARATQTYEDHRPVQSVAAETARTIIALGREREPVFRGAACRDYLEHVADEAELEPEADRGKFNLSWPLRHACFALNRCIDLSFEGLGPAAERVLVATPWRVMPHLAVALARLVDAACEARVLDKLAVDLADSPLLIDELRAVAALDLAAHLVVADVVCPDPTESRTFAVGASYRLSGFSEYAAFARTGLTNAAARVRQIHALERPYAADKAFTLGESAVVARLARVTLDRDEAWLPAVLEELFLKVSVAPTAAKTVPSQSVSIALGHAVEAFPTPEAVAILRQVVRDVRHAGIGKKLQRNVGGAELGLAARPQIALRLSSDQTMSKGQLATMARCLEAGFATGLALPFDDWRACFARHPQAGGLARALVWRMIDGSGGRRAVLPATDRDRLALHDVYGAIVEPVVDGRMMLWHPTDASADGRDAWRDRITALRIKQPFRQAFREHYVVPAEDLARNEITMFSGHDVSIRPFLGVARREGWRLEYDQLARTIGDRTATVDLAQKVYPGATGWTTIRRIQVCDAGKRNYVPVQLGDVSTVTLSEILRSVDLLVSTSGFALSSTDEQEADEPHRQTRLRHLAQLPLGPMAQMRRDALARVLTGRDGMEGLTFDARHLRLGRYAIHLATGRVTHDGDPVTIETPKRSKISAVPWLRAFVGDHRGDSVSDWAAMGEVARLGIRRR